MREARFTLDELFTQIEFCSNLDLSELHEAKKDV